MKSVKGKGLHPPPAHFHDTALLFRLQNIQRQIPADTNSTALSAYKEKNPENGKQIRSNCDLCDLCRSPKSLFPYHCIYAQQLLRIPVPIPQQKI